MAKKTIPISEHEEIVAGYEKTIAELKEEIRMRERAVKEIARAAEEAKNSRYEKDINGQQKCRPPEAAQSGDRGVEKRENPAREKKNA